jgi:hypothetical protein
MSMTLSQPRDPAIIAINEPTTSQSEDKTKMEKATTLPSTPIPTSTTPINNSNDTFKPVAPSVPKPKVNHGAVFLKILNVSIKGFNSASTPQKTSLYSSMDLSKSIQVDFDMKERDTGPELFEIDALLFCVQEKLNSSHSYFDYLLSVYLNLQPYTSRDWHASVTRSVTTQLFLLLQQEPDFTKILILRMMSSCALTDVYGSKEGLTIAQFEEVFSAVFSHFTSSELPSLLYTPIELLVNALVQNSSITSEFYPPLRTIQVFFKSETLRHVLLAHPLWLTSVHPSVSRIGAMASVHHTILGSILSVSCVNQSNLGLTGVTSQSMPVTLVNELRASTKALRNAQSVAHSVMMNIIGSLTQDEDGNDAFLTWTADFLSVMPLKPNSMQYTMQWGQNIDLQRKDGFYLNLMMTLLHSHSQMVNKMDTSTKLDLFSSIDPSFMENNKYQLKFSERALLLNMEDNLTMETRKETKHEKRNSLQVRHNEYFFFILNLTHSLYIPIADRFKSITQQLSKMMLQARSIPGPEDPNHPHRQMMANISIKMCSIHSGMILLTEETIKFFDFASSWLNYLGLSHLSQHHPALKHVPSFMIESMLQYLSWRVNLEIEDLVILEKVPMGPLPSALVKSLISIFSHPRVSNYHILTSSVAVLNGLYCSSKTLRLTQAASSEMDELVVPLINYYVNVEKTGSRAAFYEKFPVRRQIATLLRNPLAKRKLLVVCTDSSVFMPFITVLLNDNLFLLDETLLKLSRIHELQANLVRLNAIPNKSNEEQQQVTETNQGLEESLGQMRALSTFGNDSFLLFEVLSSISLQSIVEHVKGGITTSSISSANPSSSSSTDSSKSSLALPTPVMLDDQLLDQLSVMMNYFMDHFSSPIKRKKLFYRKNDGSSEEEAMAFNPRQILSCLILTYLNIDHMCALMSELDKSSGIEANKFQNLIVRESRSYHLSIFEEALNIVNSRGIVFSPTALQALRLEWGTSTNNSLSSSSSSSSSARAAIDRPMPTMELNEISPFVVWKLERFMEKLKEREVEARELEIPESEIPDHFLDALLATLMRDPVRLPSGHVVDRSTIVRQLAGHDKSDPFTRLPLTIDQVTPDTNLQQEIQQWVASWAVKAKTIQTNATTTTTASETEPNADAGNENCQTDS